MEKGRDALDSRERQSRRAHGYIKDRICFLLGVLESEPSPAHFPAPLYPQEPSVALLDLED